MTFYIAFFPHLTGLKRAIYENFYDFPSDLSVVIELVLSIHQFQTRLVEDMGSNNTPCIYARIILQIRLREETDLFCEG